MARWPSPRPTDCPSAPSRVCRHMHTPTCSPAASREVVVVVFAVTVTAVITLRRQHRGTLLHVFLNHLKSSQPPQDCPQAHFTDRQQTARSGHRLGVPGQCVAEPGPEDTPPCRERRPAQQRGCQRNPGVLIPVLLPPLLATSGACKLSPQKASQYPFSALQTRWSLWQPRRSATTTSKQPDTVETQRAGKTGFAKIGNGPNSGLCTGACQALLQIMEP